MEEQRQQLEKEMKEREERMRQKQELMRQQEEAERLHKERLRQMQLEQEENNRMFEQGLLVDNFVENQLGSRSDGSDADDFEDPGMLEKRDTSGKMKVHTINMKSKKVRKIFGTEQDAEPITRKTTYCPEGLKRLKMARTQRKSKSMPDLEVSEHVIDKVVEARRSVILIEAIKQMEDNDEVELVESSKNQSMNQRTSKDSSI